MNKPRRKFTFICSTLILAAMLFASVSGCSSKPVTSEASSSQASQAVELLDGGVTNPTGYDPIVTKPVTLKVGMVYNALMGDIAKNEIWKTIEKRTGIKVEIVSYSDQEKVNLMFATRDYPDIILRTDVKNPIVLDAAAAGDLVKLDPLLEKYAPLWSTFFKQNPVMAKYVQARDGSMYSLPYVEWLDWQINLRDQWFINGDWMKELNIAEPKTTAEFKNYLMKVKENAGKGSIPKNAIPFYMLYNSWIGGQFDVYASFGVYMCQTPGATGINYLTLDKGKIKSQIGNPDLKEAIKYLADLYKNGLMAPEMFTDDWGAYLSKITSTPAIAGSLGTHNNNGKAWWKAIGPLDSGNGRASYIRAQSKSVRLNAFMIFKNNKYPVASLRLANMLSDPKGLLIDEYLGYEGIHWTKSGDKYQINPTVDAKQEGDSFKKLTNFGITLVDDNIVSKYFTYPAITTAGTREYEYYNRYKAKIPLDKQIPSIPDTFYTAKENELIAQYALDCESYIKKTVASWITGKTNIDTEWDQLLPKLNEMGYQKYIDLLQAGYEKITK